MEPAVLAVEWEYMWPSPPPVSQQDAVPLRLPDGAGSSGVHVAQPASVVEPFCPAAGGQKGHHHPSEREFPPALFFAPFGSGSGLCRRFVCLAFGWALALLLAAVAVERCGLIFFSSKFVAW